MNYEVCIYILYRKYLYSLTIIRASQGWDYNIIVISQGTTLVLYLATRQCQEIIMMCWSVLSWALAHEYFYAEPIYTCTCTDIILFLFGIPVINWIHSDGISDIGLSLINPNQFSRSWLYWLNQYTHMYARPWYTEKHVSACG